MTGAAGVTAAGVPVGAAAGVGPDLYRAVMRHQANSVAVVTAGTDAPVGFCATSVVSLSFDPPLVSFAVGLHATSWQTIRTARHVMVHLLADGQQDLARRFAHSGGAKFGPETRWHRGAHGLPALDGVLARLVLAPVHRFQVGDHALVVGLAVAAGHAATGRPLLYHDGGFARLAGDATA